MLDNFKYQVPFTEKNSSAAAASEAKLRENLKETILKSGVLDAVKAQIRHEFITGIRIKNHDSTKPSSFFDLRERAICSMVFHFLKRRSLNNTLSVFVAECGLSDKSSILSETDLLQTLKFNAVSNSYKLLHNLEGNKNSSTKRVLLENLLDDGLREKKRDTLLDLLIHFSLSINEEKSNDMETQTQITGPGVRESLDLHISQLRDSYAQNATAERQSPAKSIEERMISFQRDCEDRLRRDLELQFKNFKETSAMKIRLEEAQKARLSVETMRRELEADYSRRLQFHIDREEITNKRFAEQERQFNQSQYDARQVMQREIDELRNREQLSARKIDLESQGLKVLELRVKEAQTLVENRERELSTREKKLSERESTVFEQARREARDQVRLELEQLQVDRAALAVERQRVQDDRASQLALVESATTLKSQLKAAHDQISQRDDEIASLRKIADRTNMIRLEEEANLTHIMSSVDPKMHEYSKAQQIIKLVQRNAGLEIELASLKDSAMLKAESMKKQKEIVRLEEIIRNQTAKLEMSSIVTRQEIEQLATALSAEKSKVAALSHKMEELQRLLKDKTQTIDSLRRQLDRSNREGAEDSQGKKRSTAFEMPNFRENKGNVSEVRNRDIYRQREFHDVKFGDPAHASLHTSDINSAIAGHMEILSAKLYRDIFEQLQQQPPYRGAYVPTPPSVYQPLITAPLYNAPPMPPSTLQWQQAVPPHQQPSLLQSVPSAQQFDPKPLSDAATATTEIYHKNMAESKRVGVPSDIGSIVTPRMVDVTAAGVFGKPPSQVKIDFPTETVPLPVGIDDLNSEKLKLLAESAKKEEELARQRRIVEEKELEAVKQLQEQEQREMEMKLVKEMEAKQRDAAMQQQNHEEEARLEAESAREDEQRKRKIREAEQAAEEEQSKEAESERQREQEAKEALRLLKEAQAEQDRLEREQQLAAEQQKEKEAELEREQALQREEEQRLQQEREREQAAKRKEDDDAAMIQEARARVLARRKQKQLRDSGGESLASSVSVSASSTTSFRNENNLHEAAPFYSFASTTASMQAPSASLDIAASVSLPSSSISRSAASASYRYKDADKVDSDEAEQDEDEQKRVRGSGGYESSFFGSRDRSSRWTASQERANDNRSQARNSTIPEMSKDSDDSNGDVQIEHGNNTLDESSEDQWS